MPTISCLSGVQILDLMLSQARTYALPFGDVSRQSEWWGWIYLWTTLVFFVHLTLWFREKAGIDHLVCPRHAQSLANHESDLLLR